MKDFIIRLAILILIFIIVPLFLIYVLFDSVDSNLIKVYNHKTKEVFEIDFEKYLIGVVAAEMPADFDEEALKAQAVAARTYAAKRSQTNMKEHITAQVCTDYAHCQAYLNPDELREKWGKNYKKLYNKIESSVEDTKNECLWYDGEYATAVFHSCSNEMTENASDVWGGSIDYLICVESPGDTIKKDYVSEKKISIDEFSGILAQNDIKTCTPNTQFPIIGETVLTEGNNVGSISFYGVPFTGVEVRNIFSLKSSAFEMALDDNNVTFTVYGSGHGVGMSQYGAQSMAKEGKNYKSILAHYYPGTEISDMYK